MKKNENSFFTFFPLARGEKYGTMILTADRLKSRSARKCFYGLFATRRWQHKPPRAERSACALKRERRMKTCDQLTPIAHYSDSITEAVQSRIQYKMNDYAEYRFTSPQSCAINIFFDLAQEFDEIPSLHLLTVLILRMFFQYEAELYLKNSKNILERKTPAIGPEETPLPDLHHEPWCEGRRCCIPVRGRGSFVVTRDHRIVADEDLMGVLVIHHTIFPMQQHDMLFLEKFANRVGFCLHNKNLAERNAHHVLFVRKLAHDIGHNVITPNMRLKHLLNQLTVQIDELGAAAASLPEGAAVRGLQQKMAEHTKNIMGHFTNSAMFLESLLRQSHFDLGHYVLRCSRLDICKLVVLPQIERYRPHLEEKNIFLAKDQPVIPGQPCMVMADLGLISQVLANFLSNAIKYSEPVAEGKQATVACHVDVVRDAFPDKEYPDGVRVLVTSSGESIPENEACMLFEDNYRATNASGQYGTGHGLYFVREIVAEHGGYTGYTPLKNGNGFYFVLPLIA